MLCLSLFLCVDLSAQLMSTRQYIDSFKLVAMQEMRAYGVPASITLGQGVLESASGNSKSIRQVVVCLDKVTAHKIVGRSGWNNSCNTMTRRW